MIRRLPQVLVAATIAFFLGAAWFQRSDPDLIAIVIIGLMLTVLALVGGVVAAKLPGNPVGWLLLATAVNISVSLLVTGYAKYAIEVQPGSLPAGSFVAWLSLWTPAPAGAFAICALLLFPNGRLLSDRWRILVYVVVVGTVLQMVGLAVKPGPIDNVPSVENPVQVTFGKLLFDLAGGPVTALLMAATIGAIVSLLVRMKRSKGDERQQLKWFVYAVVTFPVLFALAVAADAVLDAQLGPGDHYVDFLLIMLGALLIPVAMGVSILRYRLYDIDVIVNRTLVYGGLTTLLAGFYLTAVFVLQRLLDPLTADSDIAIAASTLAAAGLFRPLRSRLQTFIDHRFYRRKYDAAATLGEFSSRLREQVDLDELSRELVGVVGETMQPRHASIWLRTGRTT